ncbi:C2H2 and C2HC zinc finger [Glarea lozoyensis ATCC 20868]|uniref:C2H2 and C2HC zinc finger n=1 Tax=Glarea lozoyensis (strain ATCC 20868 / MF5171) TaxID=1116229 RepID=S3D269_GLAL2|nr:C2H2 and C2HC zinc finger [Glarea lozoyensis ATCC 20868]EPE32632.1 C2H2 and C2HC zinc finger [Glarea lozoyensis ATCC 20868]
MASQDLPSSGNPAVGASSSEPSTYPSTANFPQSDCTTPNARSLKRSRPEQPQSLGLTPITNASLTTSPSPKSPRFKGTFSPSYSPMPLTGAAAYADQQRRNDETQRREDIRTLRQQISENPSHKALSSLMAGGGAVMSKPGDAPVATMTMSEGLSTAANAISIPPPSPMQFDHTSETSPASITSLASLGNTAPTATAGSTVVASPGSMTGVVEADNRELRGNDGSHLQPPHDEAPSNRALSFPGHLLARADNPRNPQRGVSLPMPGQGQAIAPRPPSQKKHKCPYCDTDFTRHHNLKSHLLTHSQEKPYVCQHCNMRFRRLHDLKRHMKLHTGERPHICPKCDRKFARGDALARHSKGQGGCAGRRASMGSFGDNDEVDESNRGDAEEGMDGVMYSNGTSHPNESEMTEEDRRRFSLPSIKAQHVRSNHGSGDSTLSAQRTPSTYPPAGPRPAQNAGGLYPPNSDRMASTSSTTSSIQSSAGGNRTPGASLSSLPLNTTGPSMFSQSGMTESPKPLSPGGMLAHQLGADQSGRQRSPSLTTQFQQQHFGRHNSGRSPPPGVHSPRSSHNTKLPGMSSLAPPEGRYTLPSQTASQMNATNGTHGQPIQATSGQPTSSSGMFQQPHSVAPSRGIASNIVNQPAGNDANVFLVIEQMEAKMKQMEEQIVSMEKHNRNQEEKINQLADENQFLRNQLNGHNGQAHHQPLQS